jgi:hypothetical protein
MINLGGQSNLNNPSEIMRRAKQERQLREKFKHQQAAVSVIQVRDRAQPPVDNLQAC